MIIYLCIKYESKALIFSKDIEGKPFFIRTDRMDVHTAAMFVRLSLLTMTNPNQLCNVLLFVCSKMADETNLSSKLPVADRTREV